MREAQCDVQRTPRVVFACKSNTCRSQMAEGWANEWIRTQLERHRESPKKAALSMFKKRSALPSHSSFLVASVATCEKSIYESAAPSCPCDDLCDTQLQRKPVKIKAVETMALQGVDISNHAPKTVDEILPRSAFIEGHQPIDKLVILCSCAGDLSGLVRFAKSVEEWNVDAPTAAEKSGEVDAYLRVSLEIKRGVDELMQNMFGNELGDDDKTYT